MISQSLSRYKIIFPAEHGSWSLMLTPLIVGAGVGLLSPAPTPFVTTVLCIMAILAVFLVRQPVSTLVRIRRGKGRTSDQPVALFWIGLLGSLAGLCGLGLVWNERTVIFWLAIPALVVLALTLILSTLTSPRHLGIEVLGVIGLSIGAPAGYVAVSGRLDQLAWIVWIISGAHNVISVLYVRMRIDQQHQRSSDVQAAWVLTAHGIALVILTIGALNDWLPWPVTILVGLLLMRALDASLRRPRIESVKRFGFAEMGLALAFAAVVIVSYAVYD